MGYYDCVDCDRGMDSSDLCCGQCDRCYNEDYLCERCASDRGKNPNCRHCMQGCSNCKNVGDDGLDYSDIGFRKCECESCPMNKVFGNGDMCERCFEEQAEKYECAGGCEVWVVDECGHTTCTALQTSEETPEDDCPQCYGKKKKAADKKKQAADKKKQAAEKKKQAAAAKKDAPSIKEFISTLTCESAKAKLQEWVDEHPEAYKATPKRKR